MDYSIPRIETERLMLREFTDADIDPWAEKFFADRELVRYLPSSELPPRERARQTVDYFSRQWSKCGYGVWAITDKVAGQVMGHSGLIEVEQTGEVEADLGVVRAYWGSGVAAEALRAALRFGFEQANLPKIIGLSHPNNLAIRVLGRQLGFVYEKTAVYFGRTQAYSSITRERFQPDNSLYRLLRPSQENTQWP